jgi:protein SCO1/2
MKRRWLMAMGAFLAPMVLLAAGLLYPPSASWLHSFDRERFHGREVTSQDWVASFSLEDATGRRRTPADFRGKVVLLTFGYTRCPDACPTTLARLAKVRQLLGDDASKVEILFVTIDPARDTISLLANYARAFDPTLIALRGTAVETDAAARAFHADYRIVQHNNEVLVEHTVDTYLVDPQGRVRVVLPYDLPAKDFAQDVHTIMRDAGLCSPWSRSWTAPAASTRPDLQGGRWLLAAADMRESGYWP